MLNFDNIEDLVSYMFENVDNEDNRISVIVNKDIAVDALKELLNYENTVLSICDIDNEIDYNREYIVSLFDDVDSDEWYVSVEKAYLDEKDMYLSIDGYVLFHEDVNSKAMIDMQNNEFLSLGEHDWFTIGEDVDETDLEDKDNDSDTKLSTNTKELYRVNGKEVDKDTYLKMVDKINRDIDKNMNREFSDIFDMFDLLYRPYLYDYYPRPIIFFW